MSGTKMRSACVNVRNNLPFVFFVMIMICARPGPREQSKLRVISDSFIVA